TAKFVSRAHSLDKPELVARVLQAEGRGAAMIFCRTKRTAQKLADELADRGFRVGAIHGDLGQGAREKSLKAFRTSEVDVLVATDVAARGIDVDDVTHVINYQCPEDEKTYVHRIGRTGRAGRTGVAITLVDWDDTPRWGLIDKALGLGHGEPPETYSTSAHLRTDLGIPESAGGRVGAATGTGSGRRQSPRSGGAGGRSGRRARGSSSRSDSSPAQGRSGSDTAASGDGAPSRRRRPPSSPSAGSPRRDGPAPASREAGDRAHAPERRPSAPPPAARCPRRTPDPAGPPRRGRHRAGGGRDGRDRGDHRQCGELG